MYTNSAYLYRRKEGCFDNSKPLLITSCGTYHLKTDTHINTFRPCGRTDYQFLYIASGKVYLQFNRQEYIVPAGHMILFHPHQEQCYRYYGADKTHVYWMHFTGKDVENILKDYEFPMHEHFFHIGNLVVYETLFKDLIQEIQNCGLDYEEMSILYFKQLLLQMKRNHTTYQYASNRSMLQEIELAKIYFHDHYQEAISIENYAYSRHVSTCWFIRSFRKLTGSTPLQYVLNIRLNNARTLLEHTQYNITEVANLVGFEDSAHFSHLFKKHIGLTPSDYRQSQVR